MKRVRESVLSAFLLVVNGNLMRTMAIAALAGWDADNNATTSAGLVGLVQGYNNLPDAIRTASDVCYNEDATGDMPRYQSVVEIAARTQALARRSCAEQAVDFPQIAGETPTSQVPDKSLLRSTLPALGFTFLTLRRCV